MKTKIHLIAGARPNFMKVAPILREIKRFPEYFESRLVHTGQHYDDNLNTVFFRELGIPAPDYQLKIGSASHARQTAGVMVEYEKICERDRPHLVMVVGDVNSTMACAITAKKLNIKVAHVEAGLGSGDHSMPEEINRIVTDSISDYLFVTEPSGIENLRGDGRAEEDIHFVGHVMIDNLYHQLKKLQSMSAPPSVSGSLKRQFQEYAVVTLHRPSNVDHAETLLAILGALEKISARIPVIFPLHPRTRSSLERFRIKLPSSITTTEPLAYMDFLDLFRDAKLVLTDSGGLQEETTAIGVKCLTLRENTERPITITEGSNKLVGTNPDDIIEQADRALESRQQKFKVPRLWDGQAAKRICEQLLVA